MAMECAKGSLPEGPLMEILTCVPAKSICRFKCVSKAWCDLITDPHHRKKLARAMKGLFCLTHDGGGYSYSFIDWAPRSVPVDIDPSFSFLRELPGIQILSLRDCCNGLLLLENRQEPHSRALGYIVCNPATGQWGAVPTCESTEPLAYTYLAFDPAVSPHFHLFQFQVQENEELISVHAYSSATGTWSQTDGLEEQGHLRYWNQQARFCLGNPPHQCPFVNGFLHLMVWDPEQMRIVVLDVQGMARRMITVPQGHMCYLDQSQGCLHFMAQELLGAPGQGYRLNIWVLPDYDTEEWVLKGTVSSIEVFGENSRMGKMEFEVVGIHPDRNVVFFNDFFGRRLIAYNMGSLEVSVIAAFDDPKSLMATWCYVPYFVESPVLTN